MAIRRSASQSSIAKSMTTQVKAKSPVWLAVLVYTLATSFLLYEYVLQVSPSIMTRELMYDFNLNHAWFGTIIAFYAYAYTAMQLPAGLLFDRFGPRKLLTIATLTCAIGALVFGMANGKIALSVGRLLMGMGSAFAFTGPLILAATWFPAHYFSILTGVLQCASSIGAIVGQKTLALIVTRCGWQITINYLGYIGLLLTALIWLIVRDTPDKQSIIPQKTYYSFKQEVKRLRLVLESPQTRWVGLYSFAVWAPIASFTGLWGVPFLASAYGLDTQTASSACAFTWLGVGVGSPLLGWWSDSIKKRRLPLTVSALTGLFSWLTLLYGDVSTTWLYVNLFVIGLAASGQTLSFSAVKESNSPDITGAVVGVNNTAVVAGGAVFQPLLGCLLKWDQKAFLVLPLCYLIASITSHYLVRETHAKESTFVKIRNL